MNKLKWKLMLQRDVIDILIGDFTDSKILVNNIAQGFENDLSAFSEYHMPYLSGPNIVDISKKFGLAATYEKPQKSRWQYMNDLIAFCIHNDKMQQLLTYLFSKDQFKKQLVGLESPAQIRTTHKMVIVEIAKLISKHLAFGGNTFEIAANGIFYIAEDGEPIQVEAPVIESISYEYIDTIVDRAKRDIDNKEFDSAIAKARTLLEEVFCYVIENNGESVECRGNISKMYAQTKSLLTMHQIRGADKRINNLLSGLNKIVDAIGSMRNEASDAHGGKLYEIEERHARLVCNASMTVSEFILSVHMNKDKV